jgi:hypothetical protein
MEQGRPVVDAAAVEVWDKARDKAEAEWVAHLPQGLAEIAYAPTAAQQFLILSDSLAIKEVVLSAEQ